MARDGGAAMRRWLLVTLVLLATTTMRPDAQPGSPVVLDQSAIRVQSNGNELIARREAPVTYSTLEQIATSITATVATREVPVRIVRASPPQEIDYLFCVTSGGTLVLGERVHTREAGVPRYVFTRRHRQKLSLFQCAGGLALARRRPAEPRSDRDAPASGARAVAGRLGVRDHRRHPVTRMALGATCVALALAGCGSLTTPQTTAEAKPPA